MLNASNYVSWDYLNTTVYVISPVMNLIVFVENNTIPISQSFEVSSPDNTNEKNLTFLKIYIFVCTANIINRTSNSLLQMPG